MRDKNYNNEERRVGFEIEYAGLPLEDVSKTIAKLFGGVVKKCTSALYKVQNSDLGDFILELDALPLQKLAESNEFKKNSDKLSDKIQHQLGHTVGDFGAQLAPYEIICPPVRISRISELQKLCDNLRERGAEGTKKSFRYAFGLHINPEVKSLKVIYILRNLQSFLLLSAWLKNEHDVNITRRLTNFIDPFPASYLDLILNKDYQPDMESIIVDYHKHNPSRNRALDMLPLFSFINEELVRDLYGEEEKINKRPTFHYRLPNCEIDQRDWSLNLELKRWQTVEDIANDNNLLYGLLALWNEYQEKMFPTDLGWSEKVGNWMAEQTTLNNP